MLRHLYFYDRNPGQDRCVKTFHRLLKGEIFAEMGATHYDLKGYQCCLHRVAFGDWEPKDGTELLGLRDNGRYLRIPGEL